MIAKPSLSFAVEKDVESLVLVPLLVRVEGAELSCLARIAAAAAACCGSGRIGVSGGVVVDAVTVVGVSDEPSLPPTDDTGDVVVNAAAAEEASMSISSCSDCKMRARSSASD